jgi:hypothetical protein
LQSRDRGRQRGDVLRIFLWLTCQQVKLFQHREITPTRWQKIREAGVLGAHLARPGAINNLYKAIEVYVSDSSLLLSMSVSSALVSLLDRCFRNTGKVKARDNPHTWNLQKVAKGDLRPYGHRL